MSKAVLTTGDFTFNAVVYVVTDMSMDVSYSEVDVTDTGTTGDGKEYLGGRAERTFSIDLWLDKNAADPPMKTEYAATIDFEGKTYAGNAILLSKSVQGSIDNGIKLSLSGRFNGAVTETPAI